MQPYYLLRHARACPDPVLPEADWPLHEQGRLQAEALVPVLQSLGIERLFTSPYLRARQTVAPFAAASGLTAEILNPLHERVLCAVQREDWLEQLRLSWEDPDRALPGGESSRACQQRIVAGIENAHQQGICLFASHGNALSLYLQQLEPGFGFRAWQDMPSPALYRVQGRSFSALELKP
ncbi:MAG: histidine phosphatase family protein [Candidatus Sericytochromatia bacterium]